MKDFILNLLYGVLFFLLVAGTIIGLIALGVNYVPEEIGQNIVIYFVAPIFTIGFIVHIYNMGKELRNG